MGTPVPSALQVVNMDPVTGLPASISGSVGGTANAAAPTYVEAATGQPISLDLHGATRMLPMTPAGVAVDLSAGTAGSPAGGVSSVQGVSGGTPLPGVPSGRNYEFVAASSNSVLGGSGAAGDVLDGIMIYPETTSPGAVTVSDGATDHIVFVGGASSVSNLVPFPVAFFSAAAATSWKLTCGANVHAAGFGKFT